MKSFFVAAWAAAELATAATAMTIPLAVRDNSDAIAVSQAVPSTAGIPVLHPFVSFSIEFAFFPDYAGNRSHPNVFSNNLLNNLAELQGTKPYIRVGGNTQDYQTFNASLETATNGTYIPSISKDYPLILYIGPSYFESFETWPGAKYSFGFNLALNGTAGIENIVEEVPHVCAAMENGRLAYWELGNEPDLYPTSAQGAKRPLTWHEQDYVYEWRNKSRLIKEEVARACPNLARGSEFPFVSPSFAGTANYLKPIPTWQDGLDEDNLIILNSEHNYIGGATQPGVTLQGTLMNHTSNIISVGRLATLQQELLSQNLSNSLPMILGEMNSLYNEGAPGLSNAFGAALWGVDFNLLCATNNIPRAHMHQGTNYRYASWQPVQTNDTTLGTKAPYYGNIFVAAMLSPERNGQEIQVANLPLPNEQESAYAAYVDGRLARIAVINLQEFNYTDTDPTAPRPSSTYSFQVPTRSNRLGVQRLMANGSNAVTGITWDGWSYNWELDNGKPVRLHNITIGETVQAGSGGVVNITVPLSSAVIINVD